MTHFWLVFDLSSAILHSILTNFFLIDIYSSREFFFEQFQERQRHSLGLFIAKSCKNFVVVFVSFLLELESVETRKNKTVKIRGSSQKCNEISSSFSCRFFLSQNRQKREKLRLSKLEAVLKNARSGRAQRGNGRNRYVINQSVNSRDGHPKNGHPKKLEGGTPPDPFEKRGGGYPPWSKKNSNIGGGSDIEAAQII